MRSTAGRLHILLDYFLPVMPAVAIKCCQLFLHEYIHLSNETTNTSMEENIIHCIIKNE